VVSFENKTIFKSLENSNPKAMFRRRPRPGAPSGPSRPEATSQDWPTSDPNSLQLLCRDCLLEHQVELFGPDKTRNVAILANVLSLDPKHVRNVYVHGSRVWGLFTPKSDWDFIIVRDDQYDTRPYLELGRHYINANIFSQAEFLEEMERQSMSAVPCMFLPPEFVWKEDIKFEYVLNKPLLLEEIMFQYQRISNKARLQSSNEFYTCKKCIVHAFRYLLFGIQLATEGRITNYGAANGYWQEVQETLLLPSDVSPFMNQRFPIIVGELLQKFAQSITDDKEVQATIINESLRVRRRRNVRFPYPEDQELLHTSVALPLSKQCVVVIARIIQDLRLKIEDPESDSTKIHQLQNYLKHITRLTNAELHSILQHYYYIEPLSLSAKEAVVSQILRNTSKNSNADDLREF
jgi:hypothetical protein